MKFNRQNGKFILNPNDKILNSIIKMIDKNNGECPCSTNNSKDKHCPCSNYLELGKCCCNLYIKNEG